MWCIVLMLVHVQFKHCVPVTIIAVKVIEASAVTFLIKVWYMDGNLYNLTLT